MAEASPNSGNAFGALAGVVRRLRQRLEADGRAGLTAVARPAAMGEAGGAAAGGAYADVRASPAASAAGSSGSAVEAREEREAAEAARDARAAEAVRTLKGAFAEATADEDARPLPRPARSASEVEDASPAPTVHVKGPGLFDEQSPDLEDGSSPEEALRRIADEVADCERCPELVASRSLTVPGQGSTRADLMFIGEGPGAEEDKQGLAFVGRAGGLLTKMIEAIGMTREQVFIANIIKCRPPANRKPAPEEEANCAPYLARQIEIIRPKVLVALGGTAAQYLLQTSDGITRLRGRFYPYMGARLMPTFHPAYLLRNYTKDTRRKVYDDLLAAKAAMTEG